MKAKELMLGDWVRISDDDTDEYFDAQIKGVDFLDNVYAPIPVPPGVAYKSPQCYTDVLITPNTNSGTSTLKAEG